MPNIAISVLDVASIKAEAHAGVLWLTVKSSDGQSAEFITFSLGRQGKALRIAGAINSVQEDETSPIFPVAREMEAAA